MSRAVKWLRWEHPRSKKSMMHAFLVDAEGHIHLSVCKKSPGAQAVEIVFNPAARDICLSCDRELRSKAPRPKREDRRADYRPRFTIDDWERGAV